MKKRAASKSQSKGKANSGKLYLRLARPGKKLSELVSVYEDLERTLKSLKNNSLLHGENSMMQINIHKLISQLSRSKRRIERKISHTLLAERAHICHTLDKWTPKLSRRISKTNSKSRREVETTI